MDMTFCQNDVVISMSYPWDMTQNGGFVNGYGFPDVT